jgi:hypothetical protein
VAEATEVSARGWWLASRCRRAWRVPSELELEGSSALVATEKQCRPHPCGRARLRPLALKGTGFDKDIPRVCWWCGREGEAEGWKKSSIQIDVAVPSLTQIVLAAARTLVSPDFISTHPEDTRTMRIQIRIQVQIRYGLYEATLFVAATLVHCQHKAVSRLHVPSP